MKICFRKIALSTTLTLMSFNFIPNGASAQNEASIEIPEDSSMSCAEAIDSVEAELVDKGFFVPWEETVGPQTRQVTPEIDISADYVQNSYHSYPANRPHSVTFQLSGEFGKLYSFLNSPQLMSILSARIMADCYQVGLVQFNHWWEGGVPVGYYPDNTARPFIRTKNWRVLEAGRVLGREIEIRTVGTSRGSRTVYPWGYYEAL